MAEDKGYVRNSHFLMSKMIDNYGGLDRDV